MVPQRRRRLWALSVYGGAVSVSVRVCGQLGQTVSIRPRLWFKGQPVQGVHSLASAQRPAIVDPSAASKSRRRSWVLIRVRAPGRLARSHAQSMEACKRRLRPMPSMQGARTSFQIAKADPSASCTPQSMGRPFDRHVELNAAAPPPHKRGGRAALRPTRARSIECSGRPGEQDKGGQRK